jgi:hypothetical protein
MRFSIEEAKRKKEYEKKKERGERNFLDDYEDVNYIDSDILVKKRNKEVEEAEKRKREKIKELNELADKGTLYIKGGLK